MPTEPSRPLVDALKIVPLVFFLIVLQVAVTPLFTPYPGGPDLVLVAVVALALWRGMETAAVTGFFGGLLLDAMTFAPLGLSSILYVAAAVAVASRVEPDPEAIAISPRRRPGSLVGWTLLAALGVQIGDVVLHLLLGTSINLSYLWWDQIVPSVIQTGLAALILSPLLRRLFRPDLRPDVSGIATA
ncbi:MAG TPA: rod shape-determining protein MreD [Gaiellales bacterium]|nr:rod shape-determining protein MreD [Gaiellales bacterium]